MSSWRERKKKMSWEFQLLDWFQTIRTPLLDEVVPIITTLGDNGYVWIALAALLLAIPRTRKTGVIVAAALICDLILCNGIVKPLAHRIRPYDVNTDIVLLIKRLTDYSFPSGHTAASFAAVSALFCAGEKKLWKGSLVLATAIALTRLYLYVHYPTDVLGGVLIGLLCGWLGCYIVKKAEPSFLLWLEKQKAKKNPENKEFGE